MALDNAASLGGTYLKLEEVEGQIVAFRIRQYLPDEPMQSQMFSGRNVPVIADALIVTGPRTGELWQGARFIGGITSALRGVLNPNEQKKRPVSPPLYEVGKELVVLIKKVGNTFVGDPAPAAAMDIANKVYTELGGEAVWEREDLVPAAVKAAQAEAQLVGAGAPVAAEAKPAWASDRPQWS